MIVPVAALILAAGAGVRFGGPKALARSDGQSWLALAVEKSRGAGCAPVCVVIGSEAERVRREAGIAEHGGKQSAGELIWVENREWARGRTGSIVAGLRALRREARGALIYPVDFPLVRAETLAQLCEGFAQAPEPEASIIVPEHGGRRGHPILLGSDVWAEVLQLGMDEPLRDVVRRDAARLRAVVTEDAGTLRDINYREQLPE